MRVVCVCVFFCIYHFAYTCICVCTYVCTCICLCLCVYLNLSPVPVRRFKTPPCAHSKRLRVCQQNVHMFLSMWAFWRHTRRRFECAHGVFSACRNTHPTHCTPTPHRTPPTVRQSHNHTQTDRDLESGLSKSTDVRLSKTVELCLRRAIFCGRSWRY